MVELDGQTWGQVFDPLRDTMNDEDLSRVIDIAAELSDPAGPAASDDPDLKRVRQLVGKLYLIAEPQIGSDYRDVTDESLDRRVESYCKPIGLGGGQIYTDPVVTEDGALVRLTVEAGADQVALPPARALELVDALDTAAHVAAERHRRREEPDE